MIGDFVSVNKFDFIAIGNGWNEKFSKKIFLFAASVFALAATGVYVLFSDPALCADFGNLLFPRPSFPIEVTVNARSHICPAFRMDDAHDNEHGSSPAFILCNLPTTPFKHLKVFANRLGTFRATPDCFQVREHYLLLTEETLATIPIEDDMKGWNAEYRISDDGKNLHYEIMPSSRQPAPIRFTIPKKYFADIPDAQSGGRAETLIPAIDRAG